LSIIRFPVLSLTWTLTSTYTSKKNLPTKKVELPDSFFELTSVELKALLDGQKARSKAAENAPLMTKTMREREAAVRRQKYPKVNEFKKSMLALFATPFLSFIVHRL
jgi:hypothetical protein